MVGFHVFNHARHFMTSCKRLLGLNFKGGKDGRMFVPYDDHTVLVAVSHVTVMARQIVSAMRGEEAARVASSLITKHAGKVRASAPPRPRSRLRTGLSAPCPSSFRKCF